MSLTLRDKKGSPLTFQEMDSNLTYLESLAGPFETGNASYSIQPKTGSNTAGDESSTISGGFNNTINKSGGGSCDCCIPIPIGSSSRGSTIGGGISNTISGEYATIAGGYSNFTGNGSFNTYGATVGGGISNSSIGSGSTIAGGGQTFCEYNVASGVNSTIGGGVKNTASGYGSNIGGGTQNLASGSYSAVGGGAFNAADNCYSTVAGGSSNYAMSSFSSIGGGQQNSICGGFANSSFIGGGQSNNITSAFAGVLSGVNNRVIHCYSMVVGTNITTDRICTTFVNNLSIMNIPLSSAGLPAGSVWNDGGTLKIV